MKTKAILAFVVAGAMALSSCTKKIDEKTMSEINQFGTDWTALGEKATAWSQQLTETATKAKEFAQAQSEMQTKWPNIKDEAMKTKMSETAQKATEDASKFESMSNEWNQFKTTWDESTAQFTAWKDRIAKGEINPADAVTGLADWKAKMSDAQAKIDSWNTMYAEAKSSIEQNMASADEMAKTLEASPKK